jgi:L-histidine N-alpha-methyltransferase
MAPPQTSKRFALTHSDPDAHLDSFADAVEHGLGGDPKTLPCRFLYDAVGSEIFEEICELPEYYLTRAERQVLHDHADDIAGQFEQAVTLAELGSGSSTKTRLLIEAFLRRQPRLRYVPVDISPTMLEDTAQGLLGDYHALEIHAIASEYQEGLRHVGRETGQAKVIAWLGSNVGHCDRAAAARFLRSIRDAMAPRDRVLIGIDLRKQKEMLERAYDDAQGVTARFNLNLLARINRELEGDFVLEQFRHEANWREQEGRVELGLRSLQAQTVRIGALDMTVSFAADEWLHTEDSYKYSLAEIDTLCAAAGLEVGQRWTDARGRYTLDWLRPVEGPA